jgi:ribosomal protein S18 acetylase RimI-like enzyme
MLADGVSLRRELQQPDAAAIRRLVEATKFFSSAETAIALELVEERLAKGTASGYEFLLADSGRETVGYACFGPIPCTTASFDLYWIAVEPAYQRQGLGRRLIAEVEAAIRAQGGARIYVDTSSRAQYGPTRRFYERCGYQNAAVLEDFYAPGDNRVIYVKSLNSCDTGILPAPHL